MLKKASVFYDFYLYYKFKGVDGKNSGQRTRHDSI